MIRKNCKRCGRLYWSKPSDRRKYCSRICYVNRIEKIKIECANCGKFNWVIPSRKDKAKFCDGSCRATYNNRRRADPAKKIKTECPVCNKVFEDLKCRNRKYCSHSCRTIDNPTITPDPDNKKELECPVCGKKFAKLISEIKSGNNCCSKKCGYIIQRKYNSQLSPSEYQKHKVILEYNFLDDVYIRKLLVGHGLKYSKIPQPLIESKRAHLKLKREIKRQKNEKH